MKMHINKNSDFKFLINTIFIFLLIPVVCFPALAFEKVLTGLDVLEMNNFSPLKDKRVGLITNQTAINNKGEYILDVFSKQKQFKLKAIFTPEHGLRGKEDKEFIPSEVYGENIPVYSLYGETKKPADQMLKDLDILVYDIQDIGTRFYTFITTMAYAMESAEKNNITFMVLDRPNPITGNIIEGEVLQTQFKSFTGYFEIPTRYAMTVGEIACFYKEKAGLKLDLKVVKMESWKRDLWYDETGLTWINPSPNMRNLNAATLYPGFGVLETTNFSVGRGTDSPFLVYGAPWLDNENIVKELNNKHFPGLHFKTVSFIPESSVYAKQEVKGFKVEITDRNTVKSTDALIYTVFYTNKYNPGLLKANSNNGIKRSFGSTLLDDLLNNNISPEEVIAKINENTKKFLSIRKEFLIY